MMMVRPVLIRPVYHIVVNLNFYDDERRERDRAEERRGHQTESFSRCLFAAVLESNILVIYILIQQ